MAGTLIDYTYSNDMELIDIVLNLYARTELRTNLAYKERMILREYILNGYNPRTKRSLIMSLFLCKESDNKDKADKLKAFNSVFGTKLKNLEEVDIYLKENDVEVGKERFLKEYDKVRKKRAASNLTALNYTLKAKGFLNNHPTNQRLKVVNPELIKLKNQFLDTSDERVCLIVNFKKKE
jgi:hypothetical protein